MRHVRSKLTSLLPERWGFKEQITLLEPNGKANVIASSEPLSPDIDIERYVDIQSQLLRSEFPGYHEFALEKMQVFGGLDGYLRRFQWSPPGEDEPVAQLQIYGVANGRGYTATATTVASQLESLELLLVELLEGLSSDPAPEPTPIAPDPQSGLPAPER